MKFTLAAVALVGTVAAHGAPKELKAFGVTHFEDRSPHAASHFESKYDAKTLTTGYKSCCDPTNSAHISHTTTCSIQKQTCKQWVAGLEATKLHYIKDANSKAKMAFDIATLVCKESGSAPHFWVKVNHKNAVTADEYKCARIGDKRSPSTQGCSCCECKDGKPTLSQVSTRMVGEEGAIPTTMALGEEGSVKKVVKK